MSPVRDLLRPSGTNEVFLVGTVLSVNGNCPVDDVLASDRGDFRERATQSAERTSRAPPDSDVESSAAPFAARFDMDGNAAVENGLRGVCGCSSVVESTPISVSPPRRLEFDQNILARRRDAAVGMRRRRAQAGTVSGVRITGKECGSFSPGIGNTVTEDRLLPTTVGVVGRATDRGAMVDVSLPHNEDAILPLLNIVAAC